MLKGKTWKYGDDVNTDLIFPGRYTYTLMDEDEMAEHALEDFDTRFLLEGMPGDILVVGKNWGCGSAREQAVKALKARGVAAIIGKSFARIYFRNALNEGLPVIVCPEAVDAIAHGDTVSVNLEEHEIRAGNKSYTFGAYHSYIQHMVDCGGLMPYVKAKLKEQGKIPNTEV